MPKASWLLGAAAGDCELLALEIGDELLPGLKPLHGSLATLWTEGLAARRRAPPGARGSEPGEAEGAPALWARAKLGELIDTDGRADASVGRCAPAKPRAGFLPGLLAGCRAGLPAG